MISLQPPLKEVQNMEKYIIKDRTMEHWPKSINFLQIVEKEDFPPNQLINQ